jgi:hypothetical protein
MSTFLKYHGSNDEFVRSYDVQTARRQFQVSVFLIVVLAVVAFILGHLTQFEEPASQKKTIAPVSHSTQVTAAKGGADDTGLMIVHETF